MKMSSNDRCRVRMAQRLQRRYEQQRSPQELKPTFSVGSWKEIARFRQRLSLAIQQGHPVAAEEYGYRLRTALQGLARELTSAAAAISKWENLPEAPSLRLLYEELAAVEQEFEDVRFDLPESLVVVRTERIILQEVDLGPFEIRLDLKKLGSQRAYDVLALDPYRPAHNSGVTHPHVQDNFLCEGDGRQAIERALDEGRIGEFFLLVAQVLRTYNGESAYRSLAAWDGVPCADCDELVDEDDSSTCDGCGCRLCNDCSRGCPRCDHVICGECSASCDSCGGRACESCLERCGNCAHQICTDCLEDSLCPSCLKHSQETDHADSEATSELAPAVAAASPQAPTPKAGDSLQPVCVGQAVASA